MDVDFQFSPQANGVEARYAGGGGGLPIGKHMVIMTSAEWMTTADNTGRYVAVTLSTPEGASQVDRLNIENKNASAVKASYGQLAAYMLVTGVPQSMQRFSDMFNKPFGIEIGYQKGHDGSGQGTDKGYTEVKELFFANGQSVSEAAKAAKNGGGGGQQQHQPGPQFGGGQGGPAAGGFGGAPQGQGGFGPGAGQQQPQGGTGGFGGGFQAPQGNGGFQPPAGQGAGGFGGAMPQGGGFAAGPQGGGQQQPQGGGGFGGGGGGFNGPSPFNR